MNQVSELIIAKNSLVAMSSSDGENNNNQSFHEQIEYLERITTNLHGVCREGTNGFLLKVLHRSILEMIRDLSQYSE